MKRKNIKQEIKKHFFVYPTSQLRVREIERSLKLPLPSVIRYCKELHKEGILVIKKIGNVFFYTADITHKNFLLEKKLYNIKSLYESGLIAYVTFELSNPGIVLFGSYAKGEDTENSDIDLYIETPSRKEISLGNFEKNLKRRIQTFRYKTIHDIKNVHLANNIINGIMLNNSIEVFT
jgi:predicted nucleotidyltransferase